jgi:hypothetical protein
MRNSWRSNDSRPVALVQLHLVPDQVRVEVAQRLLGGREVAHEEGIEQQRGAGGRQTLGLRGESPSSGVDAVSQVEGEAAEHDDEDRHAGQTEQERPQAGLHWPISR